MRFVGREEEGSAGREGNDVEEEDTETTDISRIESLQLTHQSLLTTQSCVEY